MICRPARTRGFSLVELMASMAVGAVVLMLAVTILGRSGDTYENIGGSMGAEREARALLNQLSADLATAIHHEENVFQQQGDSWPLDKIGFLTLQPSDSQAAGETIGDLCAVNYQIADTEVGGRSVRTLKRGFRNSQSTFDALRGSNVPGLFQPDQTLDEEIAFGVVSFQVRPKFRDESGQLRDWEASSGDNGPEFIDLRLVIARPELAGKLITPGDWSSSPLLRNSGGASHVRGLEVYQTTVRFGNHAPQ